jgi:hypothetical protein
MCDGVAGWLPGQFCSMKSCNSRESCLVFGQIYIAGPQLPGVLFFVFLRGTEALRHAKARGSGGIFCAGSGDPHFSQSTRLMHPHCKNNVKGNGQECAFHTSKVKGSGAWPALYTRQRT